MKNLIIIFLSMIFLSSCGYVLQSMIESPGPVVTYEFSKSHELKGGGTFTESNWFVLGGDGNTYWSYTYQKGNQSICSGDCGEN